MNDLLDFLLENYSQPELGQTASPWQAFLAELRKNHGPERAEAAQQGILDFVEFSRKLLRENQLQETTFAHGAQALVLGAHTVLWPSKDEQLEASPSIAINSSGRGGNMALTPSLPVTSMHDAPQASKTPALPL